MEPQAETETATDVEVELEAPANGAAIRKRPPGPFDHLPRDQPKVFTFELRLEFRHKVMTLIENTLAKGTKSMRRRNRTMEILGVGLDWEAILEDKVDMEMKSVFGIEMDRQEMKIVAAVLESFFEAGIAGGFARVLWPAYRMIEIVRTANDPEDKDIEDEEEDGKNK